MTYTFRPAKSFTEQHGAFVGVTGGTNSGKSYSSMRLAQGIARATGKRVAALDTEGGRLLHLKDDFDFDVMIMGPPHSPDRYLQAAQDAEAAGYGALMIDSFSQVWRGIGGVLDQTDRNIEVMVERKRAFAARDGKRFDEAREREKVKSAASIKPQMAHTMMVNGFLGIRMPIIFSIRGGMSFDPKVNEERFKAQCKPTFPFELTVSFRLAQDRKGVIDLSDQTSYKMEGVHKAIFRDGDQLSEEHGAKLAAWARGEPAAARPAQPKVTHTAPSADLDRARGGDGIPTWEEPRDSPDRQPTKREPETADKFVLAARNIIHRLHGAPHRAWLDEFEALPGVKRDREKIASVRPDLDEDIERARAAALERFAKQGQAEPEMPEMPS